MISGERYYYLSDSNEYWYKYHHEEYKMKCDICGKVFTVIGGKICIITKINMEVIVLTRAVMN